MNKKIIENLKQKKKKWDTRYLFHRFDKYIYNFDKISGKQINLFTNAIYDSESSITIIF